jgi:enoyl-CoA hydratase/carnithine racemase
VLTGSDRAFAAGADIEEMAEKSYAEAFLSDLFGSPPPAGSKAVASR